ncbi:MAG: hypothetical protein D6714_05750 [Bacteroidetes bacterium]|nr:MAG: hypothetical protein D6714_05750 [Bacteroidota bacterium]
MKVIAFSCLFAALFLLTQCHAPAAATMTNKPIEKSKPVIGFNGKKHYPIAEAPAVRHKKDSLLAIARQHYDQNPDNLDNIIWLGRRTAYLGNFREAVDIYSRGIEKFPDAPELYRHRGHRYLTLRKPDLAIADFEKAAQLAADRPIQIEPDGIPNAINQPLSNLQFNIFYHWGLAYYFKGDFDAAAQTFEKCMDYSINSDLIVANVDWLYRALRRAGRPDDAVAWLRYVDPEMKIIENAAYFDLLLMYKGMLPEAELLPANPDTARLDFVTKAYGLGNYFLVNGQTEAAKALFQKILDTDYWTAFGYIAAEADMARGL